MVGYKLTDKAQFIRYQKRQIANDNHWFCGVLAS